MEGHVYVFQNLIGQMIFFSHLITITMESKHIITEQVNDPIRRVWGDRAQKAGEVYDGQVYRKTKDPDNTVDWPLNMDTRVRRGAVMAD
jgi:hypothetical protein